MIGLDTNVVVRYITQDDPAQAAAAVELIDSLSGGDPGFLSLVVIVELVWVLESAYKSKKTDIVRVLEMLLRSEELMVERTDVVWQALRSFAAGNAGFVDCLIERCGHAAGCSRTLTFDQRAAIHAGMQLLN